MFSEIISWENIYEAYLSASRGKRNRPDVAKFELHLEDELSGLRSELISGCYQPGSYKNFYIHEPKKRLISAAPFRDRVVHHALCKVIQPYFERSFVKESYANRIGKGNHKALSAAKLYASKYPFVVQLDVRQFFPSIDHDILYKQLAQKIDDDVVMALIEKILASGVNVQNKESRMHYFDDDDLFAINRPRGLPIGNLTSQLWANVYGSYEESVGRILIK